MGYQAVLHTNLHKVQIRPTVPKPNGDRRIGTPTSTPNLSAISLVAAIPLILFRPHYLL